MRLWSDGDVGDTIRATVKEQVSGVNRKAVSRGVRALNALRNAELEVLKGKRSGKVYKKPNTYGKATQATRKLSKEYGHKLKGGQLYRASAPGESPAKRMGDLRMHWNWQVKSKNNSNGGVTIIAEIESGEKYAAMLEGGTSKMAPRPFVDKIKKKATQEIKKIYSEPYT